MSARLLEVLDGNGGKEAVADLVKKMVGFENAFKPDTTDYLDDKRQRIVCGDKERGTARFGSRIL